MSLVQANGGTAAAEDPLSFRPNPAALAPQPGAEVSGHTKDAGALGTGLGASEAPYRQPLFITIMN